MGNEYNAVRPHEPQDRTRIAAGSPLAVLGIFLESLRERFNDEANLGIVWRPDTQITDIVIETGYNVESESRNAGRALYVTRRNSTPSQVVVSDRVGVHLPSHLEGFMCMMDSQITIDCVSNDSGESALLADIVQGFLLASRQIMAAMYGFHDVSHAEAGATLPFEHSQEQWSTTISLRVQYHARWTTVKIRPLLQGVGVRMADDISAQAFEARAAASLQRTNTFVETMAAHCGGLVTLDEISPTLIDPAAALPGLRTLGRGPNQAMPGNTPIGTVGYVMPTPVRVAVVGTSPDAAPADHAHDLQEAGGTRLTVGAVADGLFLRRVGTELVGTAAAVAFTFTQAAPSSLWIINHNLGYVPTVTVYTTGGVQVSVEIVHVSSNQCRVQSIVAFAGTARCV